MRDQRNGVGAFMGIAQDLAYEFRIFFPRLPFGALAAFTGNLATCVKSGLNLPDSLETCTRSSPNSMLRSYGPIAADKLRKGVPLSEAFGEIARFLPAFYLPVLRCGEHSGRMDEALDYLQHHCGLLERPYQAARNLWLLPLGIFVALDVLVGLALFLFVPFLAAVGNLARTAVNYAFLAAVVLLVLNVAPLRRLWERLLLAIPFIGPIVREMNVNRFLNAFCLTYRTSGRTVASMVETACSAVDNTAIRGDFMGAVPYLAQGESLSKSLEHCPALTFEQKTAIESAEQAGRLEQALATLCRQTYESLERRVKGLREIYSHAIIGLITAVLLYAALSKLSALIPALVARQ